MTVVLDAWAIVAHLKGERAAAEVEDILSTRDVVVSDINLGEVIYTLTRSHGADVAEARIRELRGEVRSEAPSWPLTLDAARIKGSRPVSYADAFAVATAQRHRAPLYTGDPEIVALGDLVDVVDLREHRR